MKYNKTNLPSKLCLHCKKPFNWRKKGRLVWEEVLYCSKKLCDEGNKILLVTFNHVLRCDLIRLLEYAKMGLMADNGVHPKSAVQFFTDLLLATQLISPEQFGNGFFDKDEKTNKSPYEQSLELLFELIKEKPLQDNEDLKNTIACYTNFDYIMIDESQDWLTLERDIIIQKNTHCSKSRAAYKRFH